MGGSRLRMLALAFLCLIVGAAQALVPVPTQTGYVTDLTGVIEPDAMSQLQLRLAQYHAETGRKIAVLAVPHTQGEQLEAFAERVQKRWGLHRLPGGAALLLWSAEGYVLIRVTDSLHSSLGPDAQIQIITRWIVPAFAAGDAARGVRDGVEQMIVVLDGAQVAERPLSSAGAAPSSPGREDAPAPHRDGTRYLQIDSTPVQLPIWFATLPADLDRLVGAIALNPLAGTRALFTEAADQVQGLPLQAHVASLQLGGERVEPPMLPFALAAFGVLGAVLLIATLLVLARAWTRMALFLALAGAPPLWAATGFTALALCMVLMGVLLPIALRLIAAVLGNQRAIDEDALAAEQLKTQLAALASRAPAAGARRAAGAGIPSSSVRTHVSAPTGGVRVSTAQPRRTPPSPQQVQELANLAARTARRVFGLLRFTHVGIAIALVLISPGLAFVAGLAMMGYFSVRHGLIYKLVELGAERNPDLRRLLDRLPAPDPADLLPPPSA